MHIPIVHVDHFRNNNPDVAFLFAWNHKEEIFSKEKKFTNNNGKWMSHIEIQKFKKSLQIKLPKERNSNKYPEQENPEQEKKDQG